MPVWLLQLVVVIEFLPLTLVLAPPIYSPTPIALIVMTALSILRMPVSGVLRPTLGSVDLMYGFSLFCRVTLSFPLFMFRCYNM